MPKIREVLYQHAKGNSQRLISRSLNISRDTVRKYIEFAKQEGWADIFFDPVMANAALDRIVNNAYRLVLEGDSYRKNFIPKFIKEDDKVMQKS